MDFLTSVLYLCVFLYLKNVAGAESWFCSHNLISGAPVSDCYNVSAKSFTPLCSAEACKTDCTIIWNNTKSNSRLTPNRKMENCYIARGKNEDVCQQFTSRVTITCNPPAKSDRSESCRETSSLSIPISVNPSVTVTTTSKNNELVGVVTTTTESLSDKTSPNNHFISALVGSVGGNIILLLITAIIILRCVSVYRQMKRKDYNNAVGSEEGRVTVPSRYECTVASQQGLECMPIPEANGSADIMYEEIDKLQGHSPLDPSPNNDDREEEYAVPIDNIPCTPSQSLSNSVFPRHLLPRRQTVDRVWFQAPECVVIESEVEEHIYAILENENGEQHVSVSSGEDDGGSSHGDTHVKGTKVKADFDRV